MGIEFLTRTRTTIRKHIDRKRVELATPDLFTQQPTDQPRCAMISLQQGADVKEGDRLIIELSKASITVRRDNNVVGVYDNPNSEVLANLSNSGGTAGGVVRRVMKLSGKAEVSLC
ncbi:hypothetical protein [Rhizobium leguminosarum]|uniref:hypothetical protein n=1 Tax=Rhizobium leguminosarum TaxID=384 RepID=UPI001C9393E3|nr:hypothetical protein [Rhizobium leguminosarum]MBY5780153.1 hypothetical protein [Rhizobium leguminosarum]MBY5812947.1 hypothetical protein [Rhizobium leguminosarum]